MTAALSVVQSVEAGRAAAAADAPGHIEARDITVDFDSKAVVSACCRRSICRCRKEASSRLSARPAAAKAVC